MWKGQFDIGNIVSVQMLVHNLMETAVQMWGNLATQW